MVNLTIDNRNISVPEGTTIMEAAGQNGIPIPRSVLWSLKEKTALSHPATMW